MMNYILIIGSIVLIVLGRAFYHQNRINYLKRVEKLYESYIASYDGKTKQINPDIKTKLLGEKGELRKLFDKAGVQDRYDSFMDPAGFGFVKPTQIRYFDNIHVPNGHIAIYFHDAFAESAGYFKKRRNESFSLYFWIILVINLPKHLFHYYGKESKGTLYTLVDVVYKTVFIIGAIYALVTGVNIL